MIYDSKDANDYIRQRTGAPVKAVERFMLGRFRYQELNYIVETDEDLDDERKRHSDLLTNGPGTSLRNEDDGKLLLYIQRVVDGLDRQQIANMIAEETAYMVSIGIIDKSAYLGTRGWADAIAEEEKEAQDALPVN